MILFIDLFNFMIFGDIQESLWRDINMGGVEINIHVHWLRKTRHCWACKDSCACASQRPLFGADLLHVSANHSAETLRVHGIVWDSWSTLTLNVCTSHSEWTRIVRCVMESTSGLKRTCLRSFCTRLSLRSSYSCFVAHFSNWMAANWTLRG